MGCDSSHPLSRPRPDFPPSGVVQQAPIIIDRQKVIALIDSGAWASSVSSGFCKQMALKVHPLQAAETRVYWWSHHPYLGYVEVNLQIPGIRGYNKDIMLLVILTKTYAEKVQVMVGSKIINRAMGIIMKGELARVTAIWRQAHFSAVILASFQLPLKCARGIGTSGGDTPSNNL